MTLIDRFKTLGWYSFYFARTCVYFVAAWVAVTLIWKLIGIAFGVAA